MAAGCSGGIEPLFDIYFIHTDAKGNVRKIVTKPLEEKLEAYKISPQEVIKKLEDGMLIQDMPLPKDIKDLFVVSNQIPLEWHLKMQAAFQKYTDNAVSKTVNGPNNLTKEGIANLFFKAYENGLKGITVYREGSRTIQILNKAGKAVGTIERKPGKIRVCLLNEEPVKIGFRDGKIEKEVIYGIISFDENGEPLETFFDTNFVTDPNTQALLRKGAVDGSMYLREGGRLEKLIKNTEKIHTGSVIAQDDVTGKINTHIVDGIKHIYEFNGIPEDIKPQLFEILAEAQKIINANLGKKSEKKANGKELSEKEKEELMEKGENCPICGEKLRLIGNCPTCACPSKCG
jgi:ribonucleoside-diphosphate reductase alpha chain